MGDEGKAEEQGEEGPQDCLVGYAEGTLCRPDMGPDNEDPTTNQAPRRHLYLWPHLNETDLLEGATTLLCLIHHRALRSWLDYADIELDSTRGGWVFTKVRLALPWREDHLKDVKADCVDYRITFREPEKHDVGSLCFTVRKMTTDAERNELLPYTFNFAEALLIAEIQAHFYNFLVGVCGELLLPRKDQWTDEAYAAKFDDEFIKSKPYPDLLPGPPELAASEQASSDDVVKNLSEMRMYSWYGSPGDLDLQTVSGLIRARVADAEDGSSFLPRHFRGVSEAMEEGIQPSESSRKGRR